MPGHAGATVFQSLPPSAHQCARACALRLVLVLPSRVRGPVNRSHGFQFLISKACQLAAPASIRLSSVKSCVPKNTPKAL